MAEGVRATIAAYTQALDDGRTDDVVATLCVDGVFESTGLGTYEGHDALRAAYEGWEPRASATSSSTPSSPSGATMRRPRAATSCSWS